MGAHLIQASFTDMCPVVVTLKLVGINLRLASPDTHDRRRVKLGGVAKEAQEAQHYQSGGRPKSNLPLPFAGAFER